MTPDITPFLQAADREQPQLKIINTAASCAALLQLTLAKAGAAWAFIAKSDKDGGQVKPTWFAPFDRDLTRPDGQVERVRFTGISMDAAWHVPSARQVKVIANSSANDDANPAIHGPAKLTPYGIDPQYYRWYNPPLPQPAGTVHPSPVVPPVLVPPPVSSVAYPDENTFWKAFQERMRVAYSDARRTFPDPNDADAFRRFSRCGFDIGRGMDAAKAADKHISELRQELGV